jgi:hypothetical protein
MRWLVLQSVALVSEVLESHANPCKLLKQFELHRPNGSLARGVPLLP